MKSTFRRTLMRIIVIAVTLRVEISEELNLQLMEDLQEPDTEDSNEANLDSYCHLYCSKKGYRQQHDNQIRNHIEDANCNEGNVVARAMSRNGRIPVHFERGAYEEDLKHASQPVASDQAHADPNPLAKIKLRKYAQIEAEVGELHAGHRSIIYSLVSHQLLCYEYRVGDWEINNVITHPMVCVRDMHRQHTYNQMLDIRGFSKDNALLGPILKSSELTICESQRHNGSNIVPPESF